MNQCENCPHYGDGLCVDNVKSKPPTKEEVLADILSALNELYAKDIDIIRREVHEIYISARFYAYFERQQEGRARYMNLDVDPEYNRNGMAPKYYGDEYAIPDVIVHRRNCNKHNTVYMEFKKLNNRPEEDNVKLKAFTRDGWITISSGQNVKYHYGHGFSIAYDVNRVKLAYFNNGASIYTVAYNTTSWERE